MEARTALILAIVSASLAVGLVAADTLIGLEMRLDAKAGSTWQTVSKGSSGGPGYNTGYERLGCSEPNLRLVVHSAKFWDDSFQVRITYSGNSLQQQTVLDERWSLSGGETRTYNFTIPPSAFTRTGASNQPASVYVSAVVDGVYLGTCVQGSA